MKVLIVDDEAHVIKAVKLLVPWESLGITRVLEASAPSDAIRIMEQEKPEILITDIVMDDLSGIDLMEYLNHGSFRTKVVVISGYDNFEYVRGSLQNGGVDYLLKPLDQNQLITAVKKAIDAWNQEESLIAAVQSHAERISSMTALCKENLLSRLLSGEQPEQTYRELLQICPELGEHPAYGFACALPEPFLMPGTREEVSRFRDIIGAFGEETGAGFLLPSGNSQEILFFLSDPSPSRLRELEGRLEGCRGSLPFPVAMGAATAGSFPRDLQETLERARAAYGRLDAVTLSPVLSMDNSGFSDSSDEALSPPDSSEALERQLLSALLTGNENLVDQSIDLWIQSRLGNCLTDQLPLAEVLKLIDEERRLFSQWVSLFKKRHQGFIHQDSYRPLQYTDICTQTFSFSPDKLRQRIHMDIFFLYQELKDIRSQESDMIYQVAHYMELNYNQPFSQFAYAQKFYVNKEYLCRKFKNTFQISMVTYLNNLRIEHAKQLLEDPAIKIRQIAHEVGYEDEKYFSRQFKKVTGITPGEYRTHALMP